MKTKILRNIFLSVGVLLASARLLSAGMNDGVLNFSKTPLVRPQATFVTFDPPSGPAREMLPNGINPAGAIAGTYYDANVVVSRLPAGARRHIHDVRSPGLYWYLCRVSQFAFCGPAYQPGRRNHGRPTLTRAGWITAFCALPTAPSPAFDAAGCRQSDQLPQLHQPGGGHRGSLLLTRTSWVHGFLRAPDGTFTTFDATGRRQRHRSLPASTQRGPSRELYFDANFVSHGFLRAPDGTITDVRSPGGVNGTSPTGINPAGAIIGIVL